MTDEQRTKMEAWITFAESVGMTYGQGLRDGLLMVARAAEQNEGPASPSRA